MTINVKIDVDPDKDPKHCDFDYSIRGIVDENQNFDTLFTVYDGKSTTNTYTLKADVIDVTGFLKESFTNSNISLTYLDKITNYFDNLLKFGIDKEGMWAGFWNKISEVHHRDIMRYVFRDLARSLENYANDLANEDKNPGDFETALKLEELAGEIEKAVAQSIEIRFGARFDNLLDSLGLMYKYSQGYLLYSEKEADGDNLWKSRLTGIELFSAITKDQEKFDLGITSDITQRNVRCFLDRIINVEYATSVMEVPKFLPLQLTTYDVASVQAFLKSERYIPIIKPKQLNIRYV